MSASASPRFEVPHAPAYDHTQTSPLPWLILAPAALILGGLAAVADDPYVPYALMALGLFLALMLMSFQRLRIRDAGESLVLQYGPVPLFFHRLRYDTIAAADPDRTSFVDGWGIHWVPGRGWTYNLWGWDCVKVTLKNGRSERLGTDDPAGLAEFLRRRITRGGG